MPKTEQKLIIEGKTTINIGREAFAYEMKAFVFEGKYYKLPEETPLLFEIRSYPEKKIYIRNAFLDIHEFGSHYEEAWENTIISLLDLKSILEVADVDELSMKAREAQKYLSSFTGVILE